ncbi:hypothetical protein GGR01_001320 [Acetobacter oeni]|nr:hypothetical protein [Acetobacter oeni]
MYFAAGSLSDHSTQHDTLVLFSGMFRNFAFPARTDSLIVFLISSVLSGLKKKFLKICSFFYRNIQLINWHGLVSVYLCHT